MACTISWPACLMEWARRGCRVVTVGGTPALVRRQIKRNDVANVGYLYSISPPQTASPGCGDERLSGGQERRPGVRREMATRFSNAWKRNPPCIRSHYYRIPHHSRRPSPTGSGRSYESPVTSDWRLRVVSVAQCLLSSLFQSRYGCLPDSPGGD